jgi:energy-coupling factor transport system permease protein
MSKELFTTGAVYAGDIWLDPRTKLWLLLAVNVVMIGGTLDGSAMLFRPVMATIPLILLIGNRQYRAALIYLVLLGAASFGESYLVPRTSGFANMLTIVASGVISRFVPSLVLGYYVVTSTKVSEFTAAMERMRVTPKLIIPMSVMFRFFPTVVEEARAIADAMKLRGVGGMAWLRNPVTALEYRIVPLLACVVKIGEELSASALTRGLGSPIKRTSIGRIGFGVWDWLLSLVALIAMAGMYI